MTTDQRSSTGIAVSCRGQSSIALRFTPHTALGVVACLLFALLVRHVSADDAQKSATDEAQLLKAIERGDLVNVKRLATTINLEKVVNLPSHALTSPHADVIEFLRGERALSISDVQMAAIRGDVKSLREILERLDKKAKAAALAEAYAPPIFSHSPLALAVRNGRTDAVRELVAFGANVNEATRYSLTPLANAAEQGNAEIVKLLLEAGAKINAAPDGYTALMRACIGKKPKTARLLLEAGADPCLARHDGQQALHFAAKGGNADCVKLLLERGADVNAVAYNKDTPLNYAEFYKHDDVVKLLREAKPK